MISTNADFLRQCGDETWKLTDTGRARLRHIAEQHERMEKALRFYAEKDKDPKLSWLQAMATAEPPLPPQKVAEVVGKVSADVDFLRSFADYVAIEAAAEGEGKCQNR